MNILPPEWLFIKDCLSLLEHVPSKHNDKFEKFLQDELRDISPTNAENEDIQFDIDVSFGCDASFENGFVEDDNINEGGDNERKQRAPNSFPYEFGQVEESNWYHKFLSPETCQQTYIKSRNRMSAFRTLL
ncbi:hypothetical protein ACHAXS_002960 [Conticribra weissflogii]